MEAGAWAMLALFVAGTLISWGRFLWDGNRREMFWRGILLAAGSVVYAYIACPGTDFMLARWLVRALLVALLIPHMLRDIEDLGARRK